MPEHTRPLSVAIINDYEVVVRGLAQMLGDAQEQLRVVELNADTKTAHKVDIALYDTFSKTRPTEDLDQVLANPNVQRVVIYSWNLHPDLVREARDLGAAGYLGKSTASAELIDALLRIGAGEEIFHNAPTAPTPQDSGQAPEAVLISSIEYPGRHVGLTAREAEVIALICQGLSNAEIAAHAYVSINSVKSYIRSAYRKIGVQRRSQAVIWALSNGFDTKPMRIT